MRVRPRGWVLAAMLHAQARRRSGLTVVPQAGAVGEPPTANSPRSTAVHNGRVGAGRRPALSLNSCAAAIPQSMLLHDTCVAPRYRNGPAARRRLTGAEALELEGVNSCYIDIDGFWLRAADNNGLQSMSVTN